jgi:hypothetical protein
MNGNVAGPEAVHELPFDLAPRVKAHAADYVSRSELSTGLHRRERTPGDEQAREQKTCTQSERPEGLAEGDLSPQRLLGLAHYDCQARQSAYSGRRGTSDA